VAEAEAQRTAAGEKERGRERWAPALPPQLPSLSPVLITTLSPSTFPQVDAPPGYEHVTPADDLAAAVGAGLAVSSQPQPTAGATPSAAPAAPGTVDEPEPAAALAAEPAPDAIRTVPAGDTPYSSASTFEDLALSPELLQGLYTEMKFERPSRIQATTLPMILTGPPFRSLIAQAHNGSGKTTCFVLGMLARVDPALPGPQALCVCPTRELVTQNLQVLERMAKFTRISAASTAGPEGAEVSRSTRITDHVVIGTHGRLKAWMARRVMSVAAMRVLVFDEADEMLKTDAFASDSVRMITTVRQAVAGPGGTGSPLQILLFSATFNEKVKAFALRVVPDANQVFVPTSDLSLDVIKQYRVTCPSQAAKAAVLRDMVFPLCEKLGQTIIFVRTRETARALHAAMEADGHRCTSIEGGMDKGARDRVVSEFRAGTTKVLISTDVLSRGFDVTQVTLVINFDAPTERDFRTPAYETYLHRIGRSGRFGRKGAAFNLVTGQMEAAVLDQIASYFNHPIPEVPGGAESEAGFVAVLKEAGLTEGDV